MDEISAAMLGAMPGILSLEQRAFDGCSQQGDPGSWAGSRRQQTCPAQGPHECPLAAAKHTQRSPFVSGYPPHASSSSEEEERCFSERHCVVSVEAVDIVRVHGLEGSEGDLITCGLPEDSGAFYLSLKQHPGSSPYQSE